MQVCSSRWQCCQKNATRTQFSLVAYCGWFYDYNRCSVVMYAVFFCFPLVTFHLHLARKRLIFSFLRDLVGRLRAVKEAIHGWTRASMHDILLLERRSKNTSQVKTHICVRDVSRVDTPRRRASYQPWVFHQKAADEVFGLV